MKKYIRDSIIFCIESFGIAYVYRFFSSRKRNLVRIVAFHDVTQLAWFENTISYIQDRYHVISPDDFHMKKFVPEKINVLITFDDGYKSWVTQVLPILEKYRIQGLFFINSGLLDTVESHGDVALFERTYLEIGMHEPLSWDDATVLLKGGHTIGGHTVHHKSLSSLSQPEMQEEILRDKQRIETKLGSTLIDFAYPFGTYKDYSRESLEVAQRAGYTYVYTAEPGFVSPDNGHSARTLFEEGQSVHVIRRWVEGSYDIFSYCKRYFFTKVSKGR